MKSKLGWGSFSTVWRCEDQEEGCSEVAVKVVQSEEIATAMAKDEVTLLRKVKERGMKEGYRGSQLIVQLLRNFEQLGPNGNHQCLVLEALGPNLLSCIQQQRTGLSLNKVKEVMSQVMKGLDFLHSSAGIIHTDVKPEHFVGKGWKARLLCRRSPFESEDRRPWRSLLDQREVFCRDWDSAISSS